MIFSKFSIEQILAGKKTMTRRLLKEGESLVTMRKNKRVLQVISKKGAVKWEVGKTYVIQEGRGARGNGLKIKILDLRKEEVLRVSEVDGRKEGYKNASCFLDAFMQINKMRGLKFMPLFDGQTICPVWVISFKMVR